MLAALDLTEEWYVKICRETLQLIMAYGHGGKYYPHPEVIEAERDMKPRDGRLGVVRWTHLLLLLRRVHDWWCTEGRLLHVEGGVSVSV